MTKTTREIEKQKNNNVFLASIIISISISLVLLIVVTGMIEYKMVDIPKRYCHNYTSAYYYNKTSKFYQYELTPQWYIDGIKEGVYQINCEKDIISPCVILVEQEECEIR